MLDFKAILEEANKNYRQYVVTGTNDRPTHVSKEVEFMGKSIVDALNKAIEEASDGE